MIIAGIINATSRASCSKTPLFLRACHSASLSVNPPPQCEPKKVPISEGMSMRPSIAGLILYGGDRKTGALVDRTATKRPIEVAPNFSRVLSQCPQHRKATSFFILKQTDLYFPPSRHTTGHVIYSGQFPGRSGALRVLTFFDSFASAFVMVIMNSRRAAAMVAFVLSSSSVLRQWWRKRRRPVDFASPLPNLPPQLYGPAKLEKYFLQSRRALIIIRNW